MVQGLLSNPHATAAAQVSPLDTPLIHTWQDAHLVRWQAMDPGTGAMIPGQGQFTGHANAGFPVGLAIDSGGLPVFSYESAGAMRIGRWDGNLFPPRPAALPMLSCGVHYTPVQMAADNRYYSACQTAGAAATHIDLYFEDGMGGLDDVRVFGNDGHTWTQPDLAMVGDDAVVAALDDTTDAVYVPAEST